ncbi:hypothetical protein BDZ94DRAFT_1197302 [Collybia nuda]|uniref:Uncharacterized protein n=1 Tax=Collybia nuda TaxID=64659 RepID=A0A9P6CCI6_9AGAR|nr:hypothetical protein BDZ94DRAFT_1197302 [Collybia nuda]
MTRDSANLEPTAGPSATRIRKISGCRPGILDPTQLVRLLRHPESSLSFASFDPQTALMQDVPDFRKLSLKEELYRPKRVVVETPLNGESSWRFVPSARRDEDVLNEGQWPRVVEICGELVECSQEQWDIYKLDPHYDCYVKSYPSLTTISRLGAKDSLLSSIGPKRRANSSSLDEAGPSPKFRRTNHREFGGAYVEDDRGEESEVEEMIIDDEPNNSRPRSTGPGDRARRFREEIERNRKDRREKVARRAEKLAREEDEMKIDLSANLPDFPQDDLLGYKGKRKVNMLFDSLRENSDPDPTSPTQEDNQRNTLNYAHTKYSKRTRTVSPTSAKRELEAKRVEREKRRRERRDNDLNAWRKERDARFLKELYVEINTNDDGCQHSPGMQDMRSPSVTSEVDRGTSQVNSEQDAREAAIVESRRKLAELEADRPLWEFEAKKRLAREREDAEFLKTEAEARRHFILRTEAERKEKLESAKREAAKREEALRREKEEAAQRERERRQRQQRWNYGPWTEKRALERYRALSESFDGTKFSATEPLTSECVPWPVLQSPSTFSVEDVSWATVEKFFEVVRGHMRSQDFKNFVEKSHRRFHPDRWRSRSLLKSVVDETERGCMEVAANTVAQALTPLWRELTGRG